jgi:NTE family protein
MNDHWYIAAAIAGGGGGDVRTNRAIAWALAAALLGGCASRPINEPIERVDPQAGYRPHLLIPKRENNDPHTLFVLSFSGGGTRAAALSYGLLEELRRTELAVDGQRRRLIDEVDVITGVSGGSFTALAYALYGERLFSEYEGRFLKRNVQGALVRRTFNPLNWWKLMSGKYGRSELAAEYYDEILFEGATFADLLDKPGPVALATGTDISTGSRLAFFQNDFDLLCSDLNKVRLSRAAATSSAVPVVLSATTFNNYGGNCGYQYPAWVKDVADPQTRARPSSRALQRYREMRAFQNSKDRPYIHLVDGGVSDNIGVRGVMEALEELAASAAFQGEVGFGVVQRIVSIIVNSHSSPSTDWDQKESPPGTVAQLLQSSGVPIERYSFETVEPMKDRAEIAAWRRELRVARARLAGATEEEAEASVPKITLRVLDVTFDSIPDPDERAIFMNLPTSFVLPDEDIDRLREIAGRLLRQSADYEALVHDLGGSLEK